MVDTLLVFVAFICGILSLPLLYLMYKLYEQLRSKRQKAVESLPREGYRNPAIHTKSDSIHAISYPERKTRSSDESRKKISLDSTQSGGYHHNSGFVPTTILPGQLGTSPLNSARRTSIGTSPMPVDRKHTLPTLNPNDHRKMSTAMNVEQQLMDLGPGPQDISEQEAEQEERRRKILQAP